MRVLLVEDDVQIAQGLAALLRTEGQVVELAATGAQAWAAWSTDRFDLTVLDLGLPDTDGMALLRRLRQRPPGAAGSPPDMPVLILSARDALQDRVSGLDQGADDYLVKPVEPEELLARMRVALRRGAGRVQPLLKHADLVLEPATRKLTQAGQSLILRGKEYALLHALMSARGKVLDRAQLEQALYGVDDSLESNALDVHLHHLRKKIGESLIKTVRGVGYFMPVTDAASESSA
jgi:DNA-binding response OmpR family regulator